MSLSVSIEMSKKDFAKYFPGIKPSQLGLGETVGLVYYYIFDENNGIDAHYDMKYDALVDKFLQLAHRREFYHDEDDD